MNGRGYPIQKAAIREAFGTEALLVHDGNKLVGSDRASRMYSHGRSSGGHLLPSYYYYYYYSIQVVSGSR